MGSPAEGVMAHDRDLLQEAVDLLRINVQHHQAYRWGLEEIVRRTKLALMQERATPRQRDLYKRLKQLENYFRQAAKLMQHPDIQDALRYARVPVIKINAFVDGIDQVVDRLHLTGRHGDASSMRVVQLPAKIYMTVLTICLVQSASAKRRPPGRKSRALLELLSILWEIASGRQDDEWDRAIRTVRRTPDPETVPAYVSASLEADDLVEDILRRVHAREQFEQLCKSLAEREGD
jgi:hypothetical protein